MFSGCSSLKDIKPLKNWNVSNVNNYERMFMGCSSLKDVKNWNVSNGNNFKFMFSGCSSLKDIKPLKNWNVSKEEFEFMFLLSHYDSYDSYDLW